jgi:hypothetical protein
MNSLLCTVPYPRHSTVIQALILHDISSQKVVVKVEKEVL